MVMMWLTLAAHASPVMFLHGGGYDTALEASATTVVAIDGDIARVTVWMDLFREPRLVGVLVPVPADLDLAQVRQPDYLLRPALSRHTQARVYDYRCEEGAWDTTRADGDAWESDAQTASPVDANPSFTIELGTPDSLDALRGWVSELGLSLPEGGEALLEAHLDNGSAMLLAWRSTEGAGTYASYPALQIPMSAEDLTLSFSLSEPNAMHERRAESVYIIAPEVLGRPALPGWTQQVTAHECMWRAESNETIEEVFADERSWVAASVERGAVVVHAARNGDHWSKPGINTPLSAEQLATLGYGLDQGPYFMTRLHLAEGADMALEFSGDLTEHLPRRTTYEEPLLPLLPVCIYGWEDPTDATCAAEETEEELEDNAPIGTDSPEPRGCWTALGPAGSWTALLASLVALRRRRS